MNAFWSSSGILKGIHSGIPRKISGRNPETAPELTEGFFELEESIKNFAEKKSKRKPWKST